ncbi:MAG: ankyrin repeat domain-containing protein [Verrucomicrobiota bacterium]|jgi:ankyrin repeat protein|nr:ankyrin repeat domain-containing protein [Verrucomicrobiota bacterium]MDP7050726.1 ankyrin repeat domain-containing protein [Verrucomicrobiota bacterium]
MTIQQAATLAAILMMGCGKTQPNPEENSTKPVPKNSTHLEPKPKYANSPAEATPPDPPLKNPTSKPKPPKISIWDAARTGDAEAIRQHLASGTDLNAKDEGGWVPLHGASGSGHKEIVKLLLTNGSHANLPALSGKTALDYASRAGHKETADLLRKHGGKTRAELNAEGKK